MHAPQGFSAAVVLHDLKIACSRFKAIPVPSFEEIQVEFLKHKVVGLYSVLNKAEKLNCEGLNRLLETVMEVTSTGENRVCLGCCILSIVLQLDLATDLALQNDEFVSKYASCLDEPLSPGLLWLCNVTRIACQIFHVPNNKGYIREVVGRYCNVSFSVGTKRKPDGSLKVFPLRLFVEVEGNCPKKPRLPRGVTSAADMKGETDVVEALKSGPSSESAPALSSLGSPPVTQLLAEQESMVSSEEEFLGLLQNVASNGDGAMDTGSAEDEEGITAPGQTALAIEDSQSVNTTASGPDLHPAMSASEPTLPTPSPVPAPTAAPAPAPVPEVILREGPQLYTLVSTVPGKRIYMSIYEQYDA